MAAPEKWLRTRIGSATSAGIYPVLAAMNSPFPLVVYRRTGTKRERGMTGNFGVPVATFSVSIVSETYTQAKDIADSIRRSVDNFTGESDGAKIHLSTLVSEQDNMERPPEGQSKPLYRVDQVYEVRFQETV